MHLSIGASESSQCCPGHNNGYVPDVALSTDAASAGETPLCSVNGDGECSIGAPQSSEYCAGQENATDCPRFHDFEALYVRGEDQLRQRKEEATAATNSLVFNAFIWLQVRHCAAHL